MLADLAASLEARDRPAGTAPTIVERRVPRLHDFAVGDQVAVTGHDLIRATSLALGRPQWAATSDGRLPDGDGSVPGAEEVVAVLARVTEVCRGLLRDL